MHSHILFCAVSLMLVALLWRGAQAKALPLKHSQEFDGQKCGQHAQAVLSHVRGLMNNKQLFWGFNCSETDWRASNRTATVSACAPILSGTTCSGLLGQKMAFNETDCLLNIRADMEYYKTVLQAYPGAGLSETVKAISNMFEDCNWSASESTEASEKHCASGDSFDNRLCLCQVVQGFQLRAVTITRALGYIANGEHRK